MFPTLRLFYIAILLLLAVAACVDTHRLPTIPAYGDEYYPPPSRRVHEEGSVPVEFHLDQHGRLTAEPTVSHQFWSDTSEWLKDGALKLVKTLPSRIAPSDHFKPDPKRTYRVTITFCLDPPGNCENRFPPFDNTMPIVVRATSITPTDQTIYEFWQQN